MNKPNKCQDKRHGNYPPKNSRLFTHSTQFYNHDLYEKTGQLSYWACEDCVREDHIRFEEVGKNIRYERTNQINASSG